MDNYAVLSLEQRIRENRAASQAVSTKRKFLAAWSGFEGWCDGMGLQALPASIRTVEHYLLYLADEHPIIKRGRLMGYGAAPATIMIHTWAIGLRHEMAGLQKPTDHIEIKTALAGIRRRKRRPQKRAAPLMLEDIVSAGCWSDSRTDLRDRAMLMVGWSGCLRVSELLGLRVEHIEPFQHGLRIYLPHSKTDQEGAGAWVDVMRSTQSSDRCPVEALHRWLDAARISSGFVFRTLTNGKVGIAPPHAQCVDRAVKRVARQLGYDPTLYSSHSMRAGRATWLGDRGKAAALVARHGRWKSLDMVLRYYRGEVADALTGDY